MSGSERRYLSEDENLFRVEYLEVSGPMDDDEEVVLHHQGDTGTVVEVAGQIATKTYVSVSTFSRERDAYAFLNAQRLPGMPRLLAANDSAQRLTLERIFGASVERLRAEHSERVWELAGQWLRSLHQLPVETTDRLSFSATMLKRLQSTWPKVQDLVSDDVRSQVSALESELRAGTIPDGLRVFAHRDFRPRNWMIRRDSSFVAVDFEHARADFAEWDLVRLLPFWRDASNLQRIFLRNYRDPRLKLSDARLRAASLIDALQTLAWGIEHSREEYRESGQVLVAQAAADYAERRVYVQSP